MKSLSRREDIEELISRIDELEPWSQGLWEDGCGADDGALFRSAGHGFRTTQSTPDVDRRVDGAVRKTDEDRSTRTKSHFRRVILPTRAWWWRTNVTFCSNRPNSNSSCSSFRREEMRSARGIRTGSLERCLPKTGAAGCTGIWIIT